MGEVAIVIAAYNEEERLQTTIQKLRKQGHKNIIVVDDASKDKTATIAKQNNATLLQHLINRGQGAALRTGINYALQQEYSIIVTYDADDQFEAKEVVDMIRPIQENKADITLGSRFLGEAKNIRLTKKIVLKLGILVTAIFSGLWLTDTHNGFRAMNRKAAKKIRISFDRMEHASEIIEEIATHKLRYAEVPVTVHYHEEGQKPIRSIILGVKLLIKKVIGW
ncbi:MAG: glycosyltransferase family 2 protein [Candidatus Woesearchaeota archaeon]